jgi:hypothetical protein
MKNTVLAFLSLIIIFICFDDAMACWCRKDPEETNTPQKLKAAVLKEFRDSSAVFSGEIVEWSKGKIKFKVNKIWKGEAAEEITLSYLYYVKEKGETYVDGCSYEYFKVGKSYLVYADIFENVLQVYGCSRTQSLNEAERDIKMLDDLKQSEESQSPSKTVGFSYLWRNLTTHSTGARIALPSSARLHWLSGLVAPG